MGNIVAIVGRPNVGKSTLFNRLTGTRQAIVNEEAGTTRDRQYGKVEWTGKEFSLIDTGGWVVNSEDVFEEEINKQVKVAIEEADVILFVVDVLNGITDLDMEVAQILRRCKRPVIVVANKADNYDLHPASAEFYSFGLGDPFCISAINGSYTGDLLDKIVATLPEEKVEILEEELPRIAIIGRPNAGKSSLLNYLVGEEKAIVTDIAGTTRDVLEETIVLQGISLRMMDTAGIRATEDVVEKIGVERAMQYAKEADLILYVVDSSRPLDENDRQIIEMIRDQKVIVLLNKSDLEAAVSETDLQEAFGGREVSMIRTSAKKNAGIEEFEQLLEQMFFHGEIRSEDEVVITSMRHKEALCEAYDSLKMVQKSLEDDMPEDFYSIDLMSAYASLGRIIGEEVGDDLVNEIFSKFCMGK